MAEKVGIRFILRGLLAAPRFELRQWKRNPRHQLKFWGGVLPLLIIGGVLAGHLTGSVIVGVLAPCVAWIVAMTGGAVMAVRDINRGR